MQKVLCEMRQHQGYLDNRAPRAGGYASISPAIIKPKTETLSRKTSLASIENQSYDQQFQTYGGGTQKSFFGREGHQLVRNNTHCSLSGESEQRPSSVFEETRQYISKHDKENIPDVKALQRRIQELEEREEAQKENEWMLNDLFLKLQNQEASLHNLITSLNQKDNEKILLENKLRDYDILRRHCIESERKAILSEIKVKEAVEEIARLKGEAVYRENTQENNNNEQKRNFESEIARLTKDAQDASARRTMMEMQIAELEKRILKANNNNVTPVKSMTPNSSQQHLTPQGEIDPIMELTNGFSRKTAAFEQCKVNKLLIDENIKLKMKVSELQKEVTRLRTCDGRGTDIPELLVVKRRRSIGGKVNSPSKTEVSQYYQNIIDDFEKNVQKLLEENERLNELLNSTIEPSTSYSS